MPRNEFIGSAANDRQMVQVAHIGVGTNSGILMPDKLTSHLDLTLKIRDYQNCPRDLKKE